MQYRISASETYGSRLCLWEGRVRRSNRGGFENAKWGSFNLLKWKRIKRFWLLLVQRLVAAFRNDVGAGGVLHWTVRFVRWAFSFTLSCVTTAHISKNAWLRRHPLHNSSSPIRDSNFSSVCAYSWLPWWLCGEGTNSCLDDLLAVFVILNQW